MAGEDPGERSDRLNVAARANVARAINVGSDGSEQATSATQSIRIRQKDGTSEIIEEHTTKEASS